MQNIYAFVENPKPLSELTGAPVYQVMQKLNNGGKLNTGHDDGFDQFTHKNEDGNYCTRPDYNRLDNDYCLFDQTQHPDAYQNGIYKLGGYIFDFRPHFKKFLVKWKHMGWQEHYAPNKMFIRKNAAHKRDILEIIKFPK